MILLLVHNCDVGWPMGCLMLNGSLGVISIWFSGMVIVLEGGKLYFVMMKHKLGITVEGYLVC
jgi:hypothetical protein